MAGTSKVKTISFIADDGEVNDSSYIPLSVKNMADVIHKIEQGNIRKSTWVARQTGCESTAGKYFSHPALKPYRIKCNIDGRQAVWFGGEDDIKAKKKEFTKEGKAFQD